MQTSDSSSDSDRPVQLQLQPLLTQLYNDLTDAVETSKKLAKAGRECRDLYTEKHKLIHSAKKIFHCETASLEDLLSFWLPLWKSENRLSAGGNKIRLGIEGSLMHLAPEEWHNVYTVCERMSLLFAKS